MGTGLEHRTDRKVSPGRDYPLGATPGHGGVNFALSSIRAEEIFLLLFDRPDGDPADVIRFENRTKHVFHAFVHGVGPGQMYGYKVRGPFDPRRGLRFNENKLLLDPYAKAITARPVNRDNLLLAYDPLSPGKDLSFDARDNARVLPKGIVVEDVFDWRGDVPPDIPLEKLVIYEVHLKGFTAHPSSRAGSPGTYLGFLERIPHLKALGVNAVEFLPVHQFCVEDFLSARGLTNYWGYNTVGFFAPEVAYGTGRAPGCQVAEFKTLVRELHRAGIEVILDVVYNHTAEGNELGPSLSFRGIDNPTYYCLTGGPDDPGRYYMNYTGCGNSLNLAHPHVIRLVTDSLRYWAEVMHVDGFRFDLASVLGREEGMFHAQASFFDAISQDPVLHRVKLIAEPWDLGTYQVGNFPVDWMEWNGRFRDTVRRFIKGDAGQIRDLGWRVTGSADLYGDDGRVAYDSVNFVTCHDGFTLWDLVSHNGKHNEANLEGNRDGTDDNASWNCGAEGETEGPDVLALRRRQAKNFAAVLLLGAGTPMILGGDEFLRSQGGNNNAYCQDNPINWFDWSLAEKNADVVDFFRRLIAFRGRHSVLQRRKFFTGKDIDGDEIPDIRWFGEGLDRPAWDDPEARLLCYQIDPGDGGGASGDPLLFVILNADHRMRTVILPSPGGGARWHRALDTSLPAGEDLLEEGREIPHDPPGRYIAYPRSTVVLLGR